MLKKSITLLVVVMMSTGLFAQQATVESITQEAKTAEATLDAYVKEASSLKQEVTTLDSELDKVGDLVGKLKSGASAATQATIDQLSKVVTSLSTKVTDFTKKESTWLTNAQNYIQQATKKLTDTAQAISETFKTTKTGDNQSK